MGREIKRVPLDFNFPLGESFHDHAYEQHKLSAGCSDEEHDECDYDSEPPKGDGWQLWQTVSDGPLTPVFATADELIDYMCQPVPLEERPRWAPEPYPDMPADKGWRREVAEPFVRKQMWAPSMISVGGRMMSGAEYVVADDESTDESK